VKPNLALFDRDPLEIMARAKGVWIDGERVV
jgi:hypothetical protein